MALAAERADPTYAERALEVSERSRSRTLVDILAEGRIQVRHEAKPELVERVSRTGDHLALLRYELAEARFGGNLEQVDTLRSSVDSTRLRYRSLERDMRLDDIAYTSLRHPEPLNFQEIRELLPNGDRLLSFSLTKHAGYLFVVDQDGLTSHRIPDVASLRPRVDRIRALLQAGDIRSAHELAEVSRQLARMLLAPVLASQPPEDDGLLPHFWIVPDGPLHLLPFECLRDEAGSYVAERFEISYVPSATVLATLSSRPAQSPSLDFLAFANPVGVDDLEKGLRSLPGTEAEVRSIARLFPGTARIYTGPDATQENLFADPFLAVARWIHFASHGLIRNDRPEDSAILLSPDSRGDHLLEMSEIFSLRLTADAVVLSACETGLGQEVDGEGIIGLSRAFLYAGSRSVVVSLWPVADQSTAVFMQRFYEHLRTTERPAAALSAFDPPSTPRPNASPPTQPPRANRSEAPSCTDPPCGSLAAGSPRRCCREDST